MKKFLLVETTLMSAFIAVLLTCASLSKNNSNALAVNDTQTTVQSQAHATAPSHSIYKLGGVYPEP